MNTSLTEIMGDYPETEIKRKAIEGEVVEKMGEILYKISNGVTTVEMEVEKKQSDKLEVGQCYQYFNVEKLSPSKLRLSKGSHIKKMKIKMKEKEEVYIRLENLIGMKEKTNIGKTLIVKVFDIGEKETTRNGKTLR